MFWKRDVVLAQEYLAFLLLNLLDLFLTGYIFKHGGIEANGIAAFILSSRFGGSGFAVYKFALVLVLVTCCEVISLKSLRTARFIVTLGCLVYLCVVFWEAYLIYTHVTGPPAAA